jgi:hypothetical protein
MHYHSFSVLFEKDNESFSFAVHRLKGNSPSLLGKPAQKFVLGGKTPHNLALKTPHRPSKHSITHVHRLSTKTQLHFSNRPWRKLHAPDITHGGLCPDLKQPKQQSPPEPITEDVCHEER